MTYGKTPSPLSSSAASTLCYPGGVIQLLIYMHFLSVSERASDWLILILPLPGEGEAFGDFGLDLWSWTIRTLWSWTIHNLKEFSKSNMLQDHI